MADIVLSLLLLVVLAPTLAAIAVAIKRDSKGPVLFRQHRYGQNGRLIRVFKFRTMHVDVEDVSGIAQTVAGDSRVTPVGRLLRARSLDELPQLLNVLAGDMSLVGPRPHVPGMLAAGSRYEHLVPHYHRRHTMRPGITGWAQANGLRGPTDDPEKSRARIEHDIHYVANFSLWLDIRILLMTVREVIGGRAH